MALEKNLVHYVKKIEFLKGGVAELQKGTGKKDLSVLDIGCGTGNIAIEVAKLGCRVTGIDVDKASIDYARERNAPRCTFLVGNAQDLKLRETYDVIIASEVLEHLKQPDKLVGFIGEHLHKEGFLFLSMPNGYGPSELSVMPRRLLGRFLKKIGLFETARNFRHRLVKNPMEKARKSFGVDTLNNYGEGALHEHFFTLGGLKRLLTLHGLEVRERQNSFVLLGTFPFYYLICKSWTLQRIDCKIVDYLPAFASSGWAFRVTKHTA